MPGGYLGGNEDKVAGVVNMASGAIVARRKAQ
jgi:hypothetical protein